MRNHDYMERDLFRNFSMYNPSEASRAIDYEYYDDYELLVTLDDHSQILYDDLLGGIMYIHPNPSNDILDEELWRQRFARRLSKKMRLHGFTQMDLAEVTGISYVTISNYMNCKTVPNLYAAEKLAKALDCTVEDLLHFPK